MATLGYLSIPMARENVGLLSPNLVVPHQMMGDFLCNLSVAICSTATWRMSTSTTRLAN